MDAWSTLIGRAGLRHRSWDREVVGWATDERLWVRRISLVFQVGRRDAVDLDLLFAACEANLADRDFFMRKGIGWGLRDAARAHPDEVRAFVAGAPGRDVGPVDPRGHQAPLTRARGWIDAASGDGRATHRSHSVLPSASPRRLAWASMAIHSKEMLEIERLAIAPVYARPNELAGIPKDELPAEGMDPRVAYRLLHDELMLDGNSRQNLATFVTTFMDEEADRLMAETLDKNMIDKDEYPQTAAIEGRCVKILSNLWNSPSHEQATGTSTTGSSEAVMLGGLALKWRWRQRREAAGLSTDKPNLVMGINVQVVWEKFCRYWDVEPRYAPIEEGRLQLNAEEALKLVDENTIGVVAILGSTFDGSYEPVKEIADALDALAASGGPDVPVHVDAASGGFVAPFIDPDLEWDFRVPRVRSINSSGHKYGLVYPGVGWVIWRTPEDLPEDLVFHVNYLGGDMPTFALNFSRPGGQVIAPVLQLHPAGPRGLPGDPAGLPRHGHVHRRRDRQDRALRVALRRLGAAGVLLPVEARGDQLHGLRRLGEAARAGLAGAGVLAARAADRPVRAARGRAQRVRPRPRRPVPRRPAPGHRVPGEPARRGCRPIPATRQSSGIDQAPGPACPIEVPPDATDVRGHRPPAVRDPGPLPRRRRRRWSSGPRDGTARSTDGSRGLTWWIGLLFAIGSTCFAIGPIPAYEDAVGMTATDTTFFIGSIFFTTASYLSYMQVVRAGGRRWIGWTPQVMGFWATAIQFVGTLFFNVTTFAALASLTRRRPASTSGARMRSGRSASSCRRPSPSPRPATAGSRGARASATGTSPR